jgi:ubiquinone/menaquinone biosynthesis C-methylase UbiE
MGRLPDASPHVVGQHRHMSTSTPASPEIPAPSDTPASFQIPLQAAEIYESAFVPAFFSQWAPIVCDAAGIRPGQRVLDVACGTGIVARTAAARVNPGGAVTGIDTNEAMLTVARRVSPDVDFRHADAALLPFDDASFDAVTCQMALMFFSEPRVCLAEMSRVTAPDGDVAVLVPAALTVQPAFAPFVEMVTRHAGPEAIELLSTYFRCGDSDDLRDLVTTAGLHLRAVTAKEGRYRAPSVDAFVVTEVESTPLRERISDDAYRAIRADAHAVLAPFTRPDGAVDAPFTANLVTAQPR